MKLRSLVLLVLLFSRSASAQAPEVGGLLPAGGLRGQVTRVRIDGKNLAGARLYFSGSGIAVKSLQVAQAGDALTADLAVDSGARLGPHEVRIATPKGITDGRRFWVDLYPNRVLDAPMAEGTPPMALDGASPVVVNGRIAAPAGRDRFTLTAAAGDTWVFDCFAERIRSRFDPVMELQDKAGVSLKLVQGAWEDDPRFCYRFAKAGRYFLTLHDSEYGGEADYTYRLLAGRMPFVAGYTPRGERPGHTVQLALQGTDLPTQRVTTTLPADAAPGVYWAEVQSAASAPVILPLLVDAAPVLDAGDVALLRSLPALPIAVDGVFSRSSRARFAFHASPKTRVLFDLLGRRIGSRIDGEIRILDAAGKEIAANDDAPGLGKDARLEFTAPAEGDYTVEIHNVEDVTGPDCYYRLKIRPIVPDFQIAISTDRLSVPVGGTISLPVTLERLGGFDGPVTVRIEGLPSGVTSSGGVIPAGQDTVEITLTAPPNGGISASDIHILGEARIGGRPVIHEAPGWERYEHRSIDLKLSVEYSYTRPHHLWDLLLLAVTDRTDILTVSTSATSVTLTPGGKVEIAVHVAREPSAKGEIKFEVRHLPAKVTATIAPIPANQSDGKLVLTAAPDAAPDLANLILAAHHDSAVALAPAIRLSLIKN